MASCNVAEEKVTEEEKACDTCHASDNMDRTPVMHQTNCDTCPPRRQRMQSGLSNPKYRRNRCQTRALVMLQKESLELTIHRRRRPFGLAVVKAANKLNVETWRTAIPPLRCLLFTQLPCSEYEGQVRALAR